MTDPTQRMAQSARRWARKGVDQLPDQMRRPVVGGVSLAPAPAEVGINIDPRRLGVAIRRVAVEI